MSTTTLYNYRKVDEQLITSGQPSEQQIQQAAQEGIRTIINLAPNDERSSLNDEAGLVEALGMKYQYIPVAWNNPTEQDFVNFEQAMERRAPGKTLIHCAANFRVTAFFSLYARKHLGWSGEQAEAFRASIWAGSDNPVWEAFIERMNARINDTEAEQQV